MSADHVDLDIVKVLMVNVYIWRFVKDLQDRQVIHAQNTPLVIPFLVELSAR